MRGDGHVWSISVKQEKDFLEFLPRLTRLVSRRIRLRRGIRGEGDKGSGFNIVALKPDPLLVSLPDYFPPQADMRRFVQAGGV